MSNLTNEQELRVFAVQFAVQYHSNTFRGDGSDPALMETVKNLHDFLSENTERKPVRVGDAHIHLVVDGVDIPATVRQVLDADARFHGPRAGGTP